MYFILLLTKDLEEHFSKTTINHFKAILQITVCSVVVMVQVYSQARKQFQYSDLVVVRIQEDAFNK